MSYLPEFFKPEEFRNCNPACELSQMDESFMALLDKARSLAGVPFRLSSAFRSIPYELKHKRSGTSFHTKGRAVDILCTNSWQRYIIVECLIRVGFRGIGIAQNFIHVDNREQVCIWTY